MSASTAPSRDDVRIRERVNTLVQALRAKDIDALMAHYASDTVTFDLGPPLQVQGAGAYRRNFEAWFASTHGPIHFELHDLRVEADGDIAFCHYLAHVESTRTTGKKADYWVRVTAGLRKIDGRWVITHEHISMPIDLMTLDGAPAVQP
jgi:uncharacterized protein (TIGR02246 family)